MPSLRTEDGSPFVHYLCKILRNHAYEHCFGEMVTLLRIELGKSSCTIEDGVRCTPPTPHGTLDKRLFIHPNDKANSMIHEFSMVKEENKVDVKDVMAMEDARVANKENDKVFDEKSYNYLKYMRSFVGFVLDIGVTDKSKNDNLYYDVILKISGSVAVKIRVMQDKQDKILHHHLKNAKEIPIHINKLGLLDNTIFYSKQKNDSCYEINNMKLSFNLNMCSYLKLSMVDSLPCDSFLYNLCGSVCWVDKEFTTYSKKTEQPRRIRHAKITDGIKTLPLTVWDVSIDEINASDRKSVV